MKRLAILGAFLFHLCSAHAADGAPPCLEGPFEPPAKFASPNIWATPESIQSTKDSNSRIPPEILRIKDGAVSFFHGGAFNDGIISWYAYDAERAIFVAVLGGAGPRLDSVPKPEKLGPNQFVRYTDAAGYRRSEFVTVLEATQAQREQFACQTNQLLHEPTTNEIEPMPTDTLVESFVVLRNGDVMNKGGGRARWKLEKEIGREIGKPLTPVIMNAYRK